MQAVGNPAVPPRHLRDRILNEVAPQKRGWGWSWEFIPRWMSPALAAALVLLIAFVALRPGSRQRPVEGPDSKGQEIARLQNEVRQWRERAETATKPPVSPVP